MCNAKQTTVHLRSQGTTMTKDATPSPVNSRPSDDGDSTHAVPTGAYEGRHSNQDKRAYNSAETAFQGSSISLLDKLEAFPRFATKRSLARFMVKEKLFEKILGINGIIVECGVFNGAGLFTWAQLSNIYEPVNYNRKIVGFDTFEGFPSVNQQADRGSERQRAGGTRSVGRQIQQRAASVAHQEYRPRQR